MTPLILKRIIQSLAGAGELISDQLEVHIFFSTAHADVNQNYSRRTFFLILGLFYIIKVFFVVRMLCRNIRSADQ